MTFCISWNQRQINDETMLQNHAGNGDANVNGNGGGNGG